MTHPNPEERPSSTSVFNHSVLCPAVNKSKAQLLHELNLERQKNEMLIKKLRESNKIVKSYELARTPGKIHFPSSFILSLINLIFLYCLFLQLTTKSRECA